MSPVIRAAYDVGSGATKLLVVEVEPDTGKIVRELFLPGGALGLQRRQPSFERWVFER